MADKVKLKVYRGTNIEIERLPLEDGSLYFAYNTGKIFLDKYANKVVNKYILTTDSSIDSEKAYYRKDDETDEYIRVDTPVAADLDQYYIDTGEQETKVVLQRFLMSAAGSGSGAAGYVYADATDDVKEGEVATLVKLRPEVDDLEDPYYYILREAFDENLESLPSKDTLIINSNGWFFKAIEQVGTDKIKVSIIAAAGTGGSGGSGGQSGQGTEDLILTVGKGLTTGLGFVYGQNNPIDIIAKCTRGSDPDTTIYITVVDETTSETVYSHQDIVNSSKNDTYTFNTNMLPISDNLTITFKIDSNSSYMREAYKPVKIIRNISVFNMNLKKAKEDEYLPLRGETAEGGIRDHQLRFIATGARHLSLIKVPDANGNLVPTKQYLHVYVDDREIYLQEYNSTLAIMSSSDDGQTKVISIPEQTHGVHDIRLQLETTLNGMTLYSNSIEYQCAWLEPNVNVPIIWVGSYDPIVIKYEYSYIRYMVYDPLITSADDGAKVFLYKNGEEISQLTVKYKTDGWIEWDITDLYDVGKNLFSISCRDQKIDLEITVTSDGARNLDLVQPSQLLANYSTSGRSNDEISSTRNIFSSLVTKNFENNAVLRDFNWQNNGWNNDHVKDELGVDNGAYLNVANGASVTIPIPTESRQLTLNGTSSYSFEIRFRIKNVQKYSTVVKTLAKYYYVDENGVRSTRPESEAVINEHNRTASQDAQWTISKDEYGNLEAAEGQEIKELEYEDGIVLKWLNSNNLGFCLGTQEAYFQTQKGVVNVRYCEDEVINISFVVDISTHLCYIYLNGILSGAVELPSNTTDQILMSTPFEINSTYCDFHLFRFRIYQYGLTMPDVIKNYLSDMHSILLYDQNQLARGDDATELDYEKLVAYNEAHPNAVSMPYCTFEIEDDTDIFPRYKGNNKACTMNFVNPPLDKALENNQITDWVYYISSPSYTAQGADINVQGTSSQKYPRRNWKTKLKNAKKTWKYTFGPLAGKPIADKNYYFDKATQAYDPTPVPVKGAEESDADYQTRLTAFENERLILTPKFHMDNETYGINKFTWKIDFMESSGTYNTGFANMMGNKGRNALYTKHPLNDISEDDTDFRTSIYGYPVLGFQKFRDPSKNNNNQYRYIGRYNMNSDKSANEIYGFELGNKQKYLTITKTVPAHTEYQPVDELQDNVTYYEQVINEITISEDKKEKRITYPVVATSRLKVNGEFIVANADGQFILPEDTTNTPITLYQQVDVEETTSTYQPKIKEIAECWELEDNQGTWCSFRYPSAEARQNGFGTTVDGGTTLEVLNHFEYRYSSCEDELDALYDNNDFIDEDNITRNTQGSKNAYARAKHANLERLFNWLDSTDTDDPDLLSGTRPVLTDSNNEPITVGPWDTSEDCSYETGTESVPQAAYYLVGSSALYDENASYYLKTSDDPEVYTPVDLSQTKTLDSYRKVTVLSTAKDPVTGQQKEYYQLIDDEYSALTKEQITTVSGTLIVADSNGQFILTDGTEPIDIYESYRPAYYIRTIEYYQTTFTRDTEKYRLYKFKNEFNKHLDKEYCLIYFIMTELLLCYDSRGKNMMMTTFGPQEIGGEYIWYPTFYDIDTQLGLNNSGAYLWDYDEDVTQNNTFSTPNSVLWSNFYKAFYTDIVQKYRELRVNTLSYKSIVGAYECDPTVFDFSYAMKGVRPILAIGLDEYYKYIAPSVSGYYDTDPKDDSLKVFKTYPYAYACQGDKKLTTELLIQNRLNYLDSQWLAGAYTSQTTLNEVFIRANANKSGTSDIFFDSASFNNDPENLSSAAQRRKFKLLDYSLNNGLDAKAGYKIKPFLHQYVTYFVDNLPVPVKKYTGGIGQEDGLETNVSTNVLTAYKKTLDVSQQINYIPAADYVSSLGDLSLAYPNSIQIFKGKKLLDLNIGSDNPEYYNNLLNASSDFSLPDLPLLLTANFNHLPDFGRSVELEQSAKLQEFKAIDSTLTNVSFAPGAPLHTILLPKTTTILNLVEHQNLTKILTHAPVLMNPTYKLTTDSEINPQQKYYTLSNDEYTLVSEPQASELSSYYVETGFYEPNDAEEYRGLYIEGVTDYSPDKHGTGHSLASLVINGGKLEYDSFKILKNLIELKTNATSNQTLIAKLYNVHWSPYNLVVKNSVYNSEEHYYELTDHGTYIPYVPANSTQWNKDLLNEIVYTYDENADKDTITNFDLFDILKGDYDAAKGDQRVNQFRGDIEKTSVPIITGSLFINNPANSPINEADLTSIWGQYFKNLNISAAYITPSNVTKYVAVQDNGKEEIVDILRSNGDHPQMITALAPTKTNYDFRGWATDPEGENMFITYDFLTNEYESTYQQKLDAYSFTTENTQILKLYAIFTIKTFVMTYYNDDGVTVLKTTYNTYSSQPGLIDPKVRPQKTTESLLEPEEMYTWRGWATKLNPGTLIDITAIRPTADMEFVAVYDKTKSNVHDKQNILDSKYLNYQLNNALDPSSNYYVGLDPDYIIQGKITIPNVINNKPITVLGSNYLNFYSAANRANKVTHIFFEQENCQITTIGSNCFSSSTTGSGDTNLKYIEPIASLTTISANAFQFNKIPMSSIIILLKSPNLRNLGTWSFYGLSDREALTVPGHDFVMGDLAFGHLQYTTELTIGGLTDPCEWEIDHLGATIFEGLTGLIQGKKVQKLHIYLPASRMNDSDYKNALLQKLNLGNQWEAIAAEMRSNDTSASYSWIQATT